MKNLFSNKGLMIYFAWLLFAVVMVVLVVVAYDNVQLKNTIGILVFLYITGSLILPEFISNLSKKGKRK